MGEYLFPGWIDTHSSAESARNPSRMPQDSDVEFLFPGLPAIEAKRLNDYVFEHAIKSSENDPVLIKLGNRPDDKSRRTPAN